MQRIRLVIATGLAGMAAAAGVGCSDAPALVPQMPWLHGFVPTASTDTPGPRGGLQVTTGTDTVIATFEGGLVAFDAAGSATATAPGFDPTGSADDLVALAVGDGMIGAPMVALAVNLGGHHDSTTSIYLYRLDAGRLDRLFSGAVEDHVGDDTTTGAVILVPGGLAHRAPGASGTTSWTYDPRLVRYVERAPATPAVEPSSSPGV